MQRQLVGVAIWALFVGLAAGSVFGRQSAEAEVRAMHDVYYGYFASGQAEAIADEIYHPNRIRFGPNGVTRSSGRDDVAAGFRSSIDGLKAQGYGRSEIPHATVCAPNDGTVIVSGKITRYLEDGGVMGELGATYIYGQTPDGWRIHATIGHDADTAIGCLH